MNIQTNRCPNCNKRGGLVKSGPDFEHFIGTIMVPVPPMKNDPPDAPQKVAPMRITKKGPGSLCKKCGWSMRDPVSIHHDMVCADGCGEKLGTHAYDEGVQAPRHYCEKCWNKRRESGTHELDDTVVSYQIHCAICARPWGFLSSPEDVYEPGQRPAHADTGYLCDKQECRTEHDKRVTQAAILEANSKALDAAVKSVASETAVAGSGT